MSAKNVVEAAKRLAARQAVDQQITPLLKTHAVVGIGSGSTVVYAVERLVEVRDDRPVMVLYVVTQTLAYVAMMTLALLAHLVGS